MKVAVLGAGAIGGYVGANLHRAGTDVHLIARGAHLTALRDSGLHIRSPRGDFHTHPHATDDPTEVGPVDHVFLGLKANQYASAGRLIAPLLGAGTTIIAAQNGIPWWYFHGLPGQWENQRVATVDPDGTVSAAFPVDRAIGCVIYAATQLTAPGVIEHGQANRFLIGEPSGSMSDRAKEFSAAMIDAGLDCPVVPDIRRHIWTKLMGNIALNPISALTRATMGAILRHLGTRSLVATMMRETVEVASALGARPEISIPDRIAAAERIGEHKTSTLQDLENGKPLELDAILAAVVELADLTTTDVPTLRTLNALANLLSHPAP